MAAKTHSEVPMVLPETAADHALLTRWIKRIPAKPAAAAFVLLGLLAAAPAHAQYTFIPNGHGSGLFTSPGGGQSSVLAMPGPSNTMTFTPMPNGPAMPNPYAPAPMGQGWQQFQPGYR